MLFHNSRKSLAFSSSLVSRSLCFVSPASPPFASASPQEREREERDGQICPLLISHTAGRLTDCPTPKRQNSGTFTYVFYFYFKLLLCTYIIYPPPYVCAVAPPGTFFSLYTFVQVLTTSAFFLWESNVQ